MNNKAMREVAVSSALLFSVTAGLTTSGLVYAVQSEQKTEQTTTTTTTTTTTQTTEAKKAEEKKGPKGAYEYEESISETDRKYESKKGGENVILGKESSINFLKSTFTKTGDDKSKEADTLGYNAAVLSIHSSKIKISDSTITTDGKQANALFAYGDSTIDVSDSTIKTKGDNSSALMVANGGTLIAENVTAETAKKNSPLIRFGDDGGDIKVSGGKYTSSVSDGVSFENDGSIKVNNATFNMSKGDVFFVSGVEATIEVARSTFEYGNDTDAVKKGNNNKHNFLNVKDGNVTVSLKQNPVFGKIVADKKSKIVLNLSERASFEGVINASDEAKSVEVRLDAKSRIVLMKDSYVSRLTNETTDNSNIFANGHKLFVNGKEVSINQDIVETWDYDYSTETTEPVEEVIEKDKTSLYILLGAFSFAFMVALLSTFALFKIRKREKRESMERAVVKKAGSNKMRKPWERK